MHGLLLPEPAPPANHHFSTALTDQYTLSQNMGTVILSRWQITYAGPLLKKAKEEDCNKNRKKFLNVYLGKNIISNILLCRFIFQPLLLIQMVRLYQEVRNQPAH